MVNIIVKVGAEDILPKVSVTNQRVHYGEVLSMETHVQQVCRVVHMDLRKLSRVRCCL